MSPIGGQDGFLSVVRAADGSRIFSRSLGGEGTDYGDGVAATPDDDFYAIGRFEGTMDLDAQTLVADGVNVNAYVARLSSIGVGDWGVRFSGTGDVTPTSVSSDPSGDAFVGGELYDGVAVGGPVLESVGSADVFAARYAADDGAHRWSSPFGGRDYDSGQGGALIPGLAVVSGWFGVVAEFDGETLDSEEAFGGDVFVLGLVP